MRRAVLVNGVPASGKSALAGALTGALLEGGTMAVPLGLDIVKEALFAELGVGDRDHNRRMGRASYRAIFDAVGAFPPGFVAVIDAWHGFVPREAVADHLARTGIARPVEIWVRVRPAVAAARYRARSGGRHPGHPPAAYADELRALAERARPLAFGPVIETDGEAPFDAALPGRVRALLAAEAPP